MSDLFPAPKKTTVIPKPISHRIKDAPRKVARAMGLVDPIEFTLTFVIDRKTPQIKAMVAALMREHTEFALVPIKKSKT